MSRAELILPRRKVGGQSPAAVAEYERRRDEFCAFILRLSEEQASDSGHDGIPQAASPHGWCYLLEPYGLSKGDFD